MIPAGELLEGVFLVPTGSLDAFKRARDACLHVSFRVGLISQSLR